MFKNVIYGPKCEQCRCRTHNKSKCACCEAPRTK